MASRSISKAQLVPTWRPTQTTEVEVVDAYGARIRLYHPLGEPEAAVRTVVEQVEAMAKLGAVPAGTYTVRSTNARNLKTEVRVRARDEA